MAYCPKCGVEVESNRNRCPLCKFPIPNLKDDNSETKQRFPAAKNIYETSFKKVRNRVYYSLVIIIFSVIVVLTGMNFKYETKIVNYFISSFVAAFFYITFCIGFFKFMVNLTGVTITSALFVYSISVINNATGWYSKFALPIIAVVFIDAVFAYKLYLMNKNKNRIIYIPVVVLIFLVFLSLGTDLVIQFAKNEELKITWSLFTSIGGLATILIILGIYHKTPEKIKYTLKKRFHI